MVKRVILDTDIGTDTDDCLALGLILASPELKLEGVTCVYGDVMLRYRMVVKLLRLRGATGIEVRAGAGKTLLGLRPAYMSGQEGQGLLEPEDESVTPPPESAADFIVRTVMDNPGQIHLICIGPLTNAALVFLQEPRVAQNLAHLTIMGGVLRSPDRLDLPYAEHNIAADAEASHIVFSSGAPITLVPLDVTTRVYYTAEWTQRLRACGTPYHEAIARQIELYHWVRLHGRSHAHDPLAVSTLIRPEFVTLQSLHVDVETSGRYTQGATLMRTPSDEAPANAQVALEVDSSRFEAFLLERLASAYR